MGSDLEDAAFENTSSVSRILSAFPSLTERLQAMPLLSHGHGVTQAFVWFQGWHSGPMASPMSVALRRLLSSTCLNGRWGTFKRRKRSETGQGLGKDGPELGAVGRELLKWSSRGLPHPSLWQPQASQ